MIAALSFIAGSIIAEQFGLAWAVVFGVCVISMGAASGHFRTKV